jgi:ABC-2 type transport system ATP-binding protein
VIESLDLGRYADRRTSSLSTGSLQRLGLARALLHEPDVLILDEPANGLDPAGVVEIRQLLNRLAVEKGVTVFMSSHILTEVDRLATRIGIIHRGRLLEELSGHSLNSARTLRVQVRPDRLAIAVEALGAAGLHAAVDADSALLALTDSQALSAPEHVATLLVHAGAPPTHLVVEQESLEDHFLRLTGGRL